LFYRVAQRFLYDELLCCNVSFSMPTRLRSVLAADIRCTDIRALSSENSISAV
jgi:hypothetical protein